MGTSSLLMNTLPNILKFVQDLRAQPLQDGCYMFLAGGNYESSLLLMKALWTNPKFPVKGTAVFALPAKDLFLMTGSEDPEGIRKLREVIAEVSTGDHLISKKLFEYRNGRYEIYDETPKLTPGK